MYIFIMSTDYITDDRVIIAVEIEQEMCTLITY